MSPSFDIGAGAGNCMDSHSVGSPGSPHNFLTGRGKHRGSVKNMKKLTIYP